MNSVSHIQKSHITNSKRQERKQTATFVNTVAYLNAFYKHNRTSFKDVWLQTKRLFKNVTHTGIYDEFISVYYFKYII